MKILAMFVSKVKGLFSGTGTTSEKSVKVKTGVVDVKYKIINERTDTIKRLTELASNGELARAAIDSISKGLLTEVSRQAEKFSSSGELSSSFMLEWSSSNSVSVVSDVPYASTWSHDGYQGIPDPDKLMDWMNYKTSFDDLDEWEMRNVAWAIRRSFVTGDGENATGLSVLRQLDPVGERYFDYIQAALDQVTPEIQNMGVALRYI